MTTWQDMVKEQLRRHEGERAKPYLDTEAKVTIGIGRCLDTKPLTYEEWQVLFPHGLTKAQITCLFEHDRHDAEDDARALLSDAVFNGLNDNRKAVVVNMAFNLGLSRLRKFVNMLTAIKSSRWDDAADEMLRSRWAQQVGPRAQELADLMRKGA